MELLKVDPYLTRFHKKNVIVGQDRPYSPKWSFTREIGEPVDPK